MGSSITSQPHLRQLNELLLENGMCWKWVIDYPAAVGEQPSNPCKRGKMDVKPMMMMMFWTKLGSETRA